MAAVIEYHFFHGFLGEPEDWQAVAEGLENGKVIFHDLKADFQNLTLKDDPFKEWASQKVAELQKSENKKILIAYSMGGRLCLHLDPECYHKLILIASHPGLREGHDIRKENDQKWAELLKQSSSEEWLDKWNSQTVFQYDNNRPERDLSESKEVQADMLSAFSLGEQSTRDEYMRRNKQKIYWICGKKDKKFQFMKDRINELLASDHIFNVEKCGHGVLFERPDRLTDIISEIAEND